MSRRLVVSALTCHDAIGALAQLQTLELYRNKIGDAGVKSLAEACASGALSQLTTSDLDGNPASGTAVNAALDAMLSRK